MHVDYYNNSNNKTVLKERIIRDMELMTNEIKYGVDLPKVDHARLICSGFDNLFSTQRECITLDFCKNI